MSAAPSASPATTTTNTSPRLFGTARRRAALVLGLVALGVVFLFGGDNWLTVINYAMIAAIAALGLNVLSGYAGQVSLGISFFMAIGAYTAAWLGGEPPISPRDHLGLGLSFLIWLPVAGAAAAVVGALVGPAALRLKGFYLSIVTLALVFIGQHVFMNAGRITGGPQGRSIPAPSIGDFSFASPSDIFGVSLSSNQVYFLLILVVLAASAIFVANVMRSRAGRAFQAIRDNEVGAAIMGVNLFQAKMGAFIFSSFLAGIGGALLASYTEYTRPDTWGLLLSIQFVAAIIIGGVASVWGSILGAVFVFALPQALDTFSLLPQSASSTGLSSGDLNAVIYGLLIVAFLLFEPAGLVGLIRRGQALAGRFGLDSRGGGKGGDADSTVRQSALDEREVEEASTVSLDTQT